MAAATLMDTARYGAATSGGTTSRRAAPGEVASFDAFAATLSQAFVPLRVEPAEAVGFRGAVESVDLGSLHVARVRAGAHSVHRGSRLARAGDPDYYKLSVQLDGSGLVAQDGREALLGPGDLVVYDTTRPYGLRFDGPFQMMVMVLPRRLLPVPEEAMRRITGRRIAGDRGLGTLVGPFLTGLAREGAHCSGTVGGRLCDAAIDMLTAALTDELDESDRQPHGSRQAVLLRRVKAFIDDELANPDLGPITVAVAHHISPRYLRKLFEIEGDSVGRWIRGRRLERCRHDLARPDLAERSVSAIAASWCLTDAAHFSRTFKATYGRSPREYRDTALGRRWATSPIAGRGAMPA